MAAEGQSAFEPTRLGYALLGIVRQKAQSGYEIRRIFAETPMSAYSSSPGTIYPALRRLVDEGLLIRANRGGSSRQVFEITRAGLARLRGWLAGPVRDADVRHDYQGLMLRLAFMGGNVGPKVMLRFLADLERASRAYADYLEQYIEDHRMDLPLTGLLALKNGLAVVQARARWAVEARQTVSERSSTWWPG